MRENDLRVPASGGVESVRVFERRLQPLPLSCPDFSVHMLWEGGSMDIELS